MEALTTVVITTTIDTTTINMGFPDGPDSKESACNAGNLVRSLGWKGPLKNEMATHSSILVWGIPWAEEPGGLQLLG